MNRILVDTSVLIQIWRNPKSRPDVLDNSLISISSITYIEFLQGANLKQKRKAKNFLRDFEHIRLDHAICDTAIDLIDRHSQYDGLRLADALIAATSIVNDLDLLTLNRRHFAKIKALKLI